MLIHSRSLKWVMFFSTFFITNSYSDSFEYNTYNNHGILGLINTPSARFYDEGKFGFTIYNGEPDQKITFTSAPYPWLEASFFYMNIKEQAWAGSKNQDYKDKGFNLKLRIKEEGYLPAIAVGVNDLAGTGYYGAEYIVGSYGIGNIDMNFGLGWGTLNNSDINLKNPLIYLHPSFENRLMDF